MFVKPDRIVTQDVPFNWSSCLCRISYVRDAETKMWHRACSERTASGMVLCDDKPFPHYNAYLGDRRKYEYRYGVKLETIEIN